MPHKSVDARNAHQNHWAFNADDLGFLCILEENVNALPIHYLVDNARPEGCVGDYCVEGPTASVVALPRGQVISGLAMMLPGSHELKALLEALPGSQVGVEARLARFDAQMSPSTAGFVAAATPLVYPTAISPTEDGINEVITIGSMAELLRMPGAGSRFAFDVAFHFRIVDALSGAVVRTFDETRRYDQGSNEQRVLAQAVWDGRDANHFPVPDGSYTIVVDLQVIRVTIANGNTQSLDTTTSPGVTIVVDSIAPTVLGSVAEVVDGGLGLAVPLTDGEVLETSSEHVRVLGVLEDASAISELRLILNGNKTFSPQLNAGQFDQTLQLSSSIAAATPNTIELLVWDRAGNVTHTTVVVVQLGAKYALSRFSQDFDAELCALNERCNLGYLPAGVACQPEAHRRELMSLPEGSLNVVQLDEVAAQACLHAVKALECVEAYKLFDTGEVIGQCRASFMGLLAEGQDCYHPAECGVGQYCNNLDAFCPGSCWPLKEVCVSGTGSTVDCTLPNFCDAAGTCTSPGALGAACRGNSHDFECEGSLFCKGGVCSEPLGVESLCDLEEERCELGLFCVPDSGGNINCTAPLFGVGAGQPCDFALRRCGNGLFCQRSTQLCAPRKALGESCSAANAPCTLDLTCIVGTPGDPEAAFCQAHRGVGEPCGLGGDCASSVCVDNICANADETAVCVRPVGE